MSGWIHWGPINWFKGVFSAGSVAVLAFLAFMAVRRVNEATRQARKWQRQAEHEAEGAAGDSVAKANQALSQAKLHAARAAAAREEGLAKLDEIGKQDATVADIIDRWRRDERLRDNDTGPVADG